MERRGSSQGELPLFPLVHWHQIGLLFGELPTGVAEASDPPPVSVCPFFFGPAELFAFVLWEGNNLKIAQPFTYMAGHHMAGVVIAVQSPRTAALSLVEVTAQVDARLDDCVAARALQFPLAQLCA